MSSQNILRRISRAFDPLCYSQDLLRLISGADSRIRVLVADTAGMRCHLLADALQRTESYYAVPSPTAKEAADLLNKARCEKAEFHVVLVSISSSEDVLRRVRFLRQILSLDAELNVVVLLDTLERGAVVEAFRSGARGIFCRSDSFEALCKCIRCVCQGQVWASSAGLQYVLEVLAEQAPLRTVLSGSHQLSKREEQITALVAEGYSNRQISERLDLSEHTIKNYLFRIFDKLGVSTRVGLTLYALKQGRASHAPKLSPLLEPQLASNKPS